MSKGDSRGKISRPDYGDTHHHHRHRHGKEERRRKGIRRLISLLLALVLGGALFCVVFFAEQWVGWQSDQLMYRTLIGDGYAYRNVELLKSRLSELLEKSSLPESILDDFYDEDDIYREYSQNVEKALKGGEDVERDGEAFGESFASAIKQELSAENVNINKELGEQIEELGGRAVEAYNELLSVSYMKKFHDLAQSAIDREKIAAIIAAFAAAGVVLILIKMYTYKHHGLQYISAGILMSVLVNIASVIIIGRYGWISEVGIGPETYRDMLVAFYRKAMQFGLMITMVQAAVLIAVVILGQRIKKKG